MFNENVVPDIAGQFGALDSARSSGLGRAIGRGAAQLPAMAQQQFLGQRQFDINKAFQGLGVSNLIAGQAEQLNQMFARGAVEDALRALPGGDPRTRNLGLALGTPTLATMGVPGTQTPGILGQLGGAFLGTEAGAGAGLGLLGGLGGLLTGGAGALFGGLGGLFGGGGSLGSGSAGVGGQGMFVPTNFDANRLMNFGR
jgi:hypothetical protein